MKKIKLLILAPQSIHTRKWVEPFSKDRDFEILVVSFDTGNKDVLNGLPTKVVRHKFGKFGYFLSFKEFKKVSDEFKPDIIHAHFVTSYGYMASKLKFHPFIVSAWGSDITLAEKNFLRRNIVKKVLNSADYVNFAGDYLKKIAIEFGFDPSKRNEAFQYGVDLEKISKYRVNFDEKDHNIVVSPRGFSDVYNFKNQILAMKIVHEIKPEIKLLMYGGGNVLEAKKLVSKVGLENCIEIKGKVDQDILWDSIGKSMAILSVPHRDGTPLSLLESMALGAFPIVSDIPPNKEWVKDKKTALIVNPDSPEEIAHAIISIFDDVSMAKIAFDLNSENVSSKADYKRNIQKMREVYIEFLKQSRR